MYLTDAKIRKLKRSAKPFKISDSHGLYLLVNPGGSRLWYLSFRCQLINHDDGLFPPRAGALQRQ